MSQPEALPPEPASVPFVPGKVEMSEDLAVGQLADEDLGEMAVGASPQAEASAKSTTQRLFKMDANEAAACAVMAQAALAAQSELATLPADYSKDSDEARLVEARRIDLEAQIAVGKRAEERVCQAAEPLIGYTVAKLTLKVWPDEDFKQKARVALIEAIRNFDPNHPDQATFLTYARKIIALKIRKVARRNQSIVAIPTHAMEDHMPTLREAHKASLAAGEMPTLSSLAATANISPALAQLVLNMGAARSIDVPVTAEDGSESFANVLRDDEATDMAESVVDNTLLGESRELFTQWLHEVEPRTARIITMHFGLDGKPPRDYRSLAPEFGVTSQALGRIVRRAIDELSTTQRGEEIQAISFELTGQTEWPAGRPKKRGSTRNADEADE